MTTVATLSLAAPSVTSVVRELARRMNTQDGTVDVARRAGRVREFRAPVVVQFPAARHLCLSQARRLNPWVTLAEFPWLLAGRNDIAWLLPYLPRAVDFSDDGLTWRAGYGPRLRRWGSGAVDQLAHAVDKLRDNPGTRQAVMTLWDPESDGRAWYQSKDFPCTDFFHFQQNGVTRRLDLLVVMRSNDLFWGLTGVNATNFSLLLMLVAAAVGMAPGDYRHMASNLHVYERHWDRLHAMSHEPDHSLHVGTPYERWFVPGMDLVSTTAVAQHALAMVEEARAEGLVLSPVQVRGSLKNVPYFSAWVHFMSLHSRLGKAAEDEWWGHLSIVPFAEWRLAACMFLAQRHPGLLDRIAAQMFGDTKEVKA